MITPLERAIQRLAAQEKDAQDEIERIVDTQGCSYDEARRAYFGDPADPDLRTARQVGINRRGRAAIAAARNNTTSK